MRAWFGRLQGPPKPTEKNLTEFHLQDWPVHSPPQKIPEAVPGRLLRCAASRTTPVSPSLRRGLAPRRSRRKNRGYEEGHSNRSRRRRARRSGRKCPGAPLATPWDRTQARQGGAGPALRRFQGKGAATGAGEEEPGEVVDDVPTRPLATPWVRTQALQSGAGPALRCFSRHPVHAARDGMGVHPAAAEGAKQGTRRRVQQQDAKRSMVRLQTTTKSKGT